MTLEMYGKNKSSAAILRLPSDGTYRANLLIRFSLSRRSEWPKKRSCRPFTSDEMDSLVTWSWRLMPNITRMQLSLKVLSLSHSDSVKVHVSDP